MPPAASSRTVPSFLRSAPVNAPLSCPNSSDSSSASGIAPQSSATNGRARRPLSRWIACATTSLPVPVSPEHEHGESRGRDGGDLLDHGADLRAGAHLRGESRVADPAPELADLLAQRAGLERASHGDDDLVVIEWLGQVVERAEPDRADRGLDVIVGGQHHDRRHGIRGAQPLEHLESVEVGQVKIEDDHVRGVGGGPREPRGAVGRGRTSKPSAANRPGSAGSSPRRRR